MHEIVHLDGTANALRYVAGKQRYSFGRDTTRVEGPRDLSTLQLSQRHVL